MTIHNNPFDRLTEGEEVVFFLRSGRKVEGTYVGSAPHGWKVVNLPSDPAGKIVRTEYVNTPCVESIQFITTPPDHSDNALPAGRWERGPFQAPEMARFIPGTEET